MHPSLLETDHRPWPLPAAPWRWRQSWLDLAFIHYRVPAALLKPRLPAKVELQEFDGSAWLGVVPFRMSGVSPRLLPDIPFLHTFPELNLRTYVECGGKPGVWFFSLDTSSWPFVLGGKHVYGLPYYHASTQHGWKDGRCHFSSIRRHGKAGFEAAYRPVGEIFHSRPGTFEHWATERYCLYSHSPKRGLERVQVHHPPWPLQQVEMTLKTCALPAAAGLPLPGEDPVCHFSPGVSTVSWGVEKL
ncbi:MAG: uncharacterized protein JWM59_3155 [Verrucomicrobiales bacterium]|nr:uncharacterized protein [Verrucomicrobiales bacterium]